jgi:hypothetical protein
VELQLIATDAEKTSLQQALMLSNTTVRRLHEQHSLVCEERDDLLYMLQQAADRTHDLEAQVCWRFSFALRSDAAPVDLEVRELTVLCVMQPWLP